MTMTMLYFACWLQLVQISIKKLPRRGDSLKDFPFDFWEFGAFSSSDQGDSVPLMSPCMLISSTFSLEPGFAVPETSHDPFPGWGNPTTVS